MHLTPDMGSFSRAKKLLCNISERQVRPKKQWQSKPLQRSSADTLLVNGDSSHCCSIGVLSTVQAATLQACIRFDCDSTAAHEKLQQVACSDRQACCIVSSIERVKPYKLWNAGRDGMQAGIMLMTTLRLLCRHLQASAANCQWRPVSSEPCRISQRTQRTVIMPEWCVRC